MIAMSNRSASLAQSLTFLLAGALLASIPFRWTVDKRGGILALLVLLLFAMAVRANAVRTLVPPSRPLSFAALSWLGLTIVFAVIGPDPFEALRSVRSDVLGPTLAFCAFFHLTRDRESLFRWAVLCAGLQILVAILMVMDPYRPDPAHRPAYVDAGVASCWLIISAAWVPVLWNAPDRYVRWARPLTLIHVCALFAASIASYNRLVWICYAVMVAVGTLVWIRAEQSPAPQSRPWRAIAGATGVVLALVVMAWYAAVARAPSYAAPSSASPGYVLQDPRLWIWPAGLRMAADQPFAGYGFGTEHWKNEFVRRNGTEQTLPRVNHAHNTVLNYTLQMGVAGGVAVLFLYYALFAAFVARHSAVVWKVAAVGGATVVAGFFVRNLTDDYFLRQPLMLFGAVSGAFLGALQLRRERGTQVQAELPAP